MDAISPGRRADMLSSIRATTPRWSGSQKSWAAGPSTTADAPNVAASIPQRRMNESPSSSPGNTSSPPRPPERRPCSRPVRSATPCSTAFNTRSRTISGKGWTCRCCICRSLSGSRLVSPPKSSTWIATWSPRMRWRLMRQPIEKGERAVFLRLGPNGPRREDSATRVFLGLATGGDIMEWSSQVALVTGSSRGIGRATARLLAQRGAAVCVNYAAEADAAEALVAGIAKSGGRAIAVKADVTATAAVQAMVTQTESELGPVTILVNNAGISWQGTLDTYSPEQVARMRAINVEGLIHTMRAVIASMRARHYGRIVNVSSVAAIGTALPGNAFYAATKAEVIVLTRR